MTVPIPVTLLTGFLGSGKTTLLNRLLQQTKERIAVVVNEFGDVGIDGALVVGADEDLVELRSGCICCTIRGDLRQTVLGLLERRNRKLIGRLRFDRIVIEASGLASPGPVLQTFLLDPVLSTHTTLDGVVTLGHAGFLPMQLDGHPEAIDQVAFADRLLLNHSDRVENTREVHRRIEDIRPGLTVVECVRAEVPISTLFGLRPMDPESWKLGSPHHCDHDCTHHHHTVDVQSYALEAKQPLDIHRLKIWLRHFCGRKTHEVLRIKGILHCSDARSPVIVHGIYQWLELGPGEGSPPPVSRMVVIGRNLDTDELRRGWCAVAG